MDNASNQPTRNEAHLPEKPAPAQLNSNHGYTNQPQQFRAMELPKAEPFRPSKPFSVGKLTLACCNFVFALIVLGLSIGIITTGSFDLIGVIIAAALAIVSLIWQIAEFITLAVRRSIHRPIHPGAHVGVHLVLWVLALIVALFCFFTLAYSLDYTVDSQCTSGYYSYEAGSSYVYCDYYSFASEAQAHRYFSMFEALTAFCVLMLASHFVLFVLACVETDRRRKHGRKAKVVYLVAATTATAPADGQMYYSQVPPPQPTMQAGQQQRGSGGVAGPSPGVYGYFAPPPPPAAAAAASAASSGERTQAHATNHGPSSASYA
ncbi:unnamed protein product [Discula destructiva]